MRSTLILLFLVLALPIIADDNTSNEVSMNQTSTSGHNRSEVVLPHVTYYPMSGNLYVMVDSFDSGFTIDVTNLSTLQIEVSQAMPGTSGSVNINASAPNSYLITVTCSSGNTYEGILYMN